MAIRSRLRVAHMGGSQTTRLRLAIAHPNGRTGRRSCHPGPHQSADRRPTHHGPGDREDPSLERLRQARREEPHGTRDPSGGRALAAGVVSTMTQTGVSPSPPHPSAHSDDSHESYCTSRRHVGLRDVHRNCRPAHRPRPGVARYDALKLTLHHVVRLALSGRQRRWRESPDEVVLAG